MIGVFRYCNNQKGIIAILFAILMPIILILTGLILDLSLLFYNKNRMQNAVDLAALSAVQEVVKNKGQVTSKAINFAKINGLDGSEVTVNYPYNGSDLMLEVVGSRTVDFAFLKIIGFDKHVITVRAVARAQQSSQAIVTLEPLNYALFVGSTKDFNIQGNNFEIHGNVHTNGKFAVKGANRYIYGNLSCRGSSGDLSGITGTINKNSPIIPFPEFDFYGMAAGATEVYGDGSSLTVFSNTTIAPNNGIIYVDGDLELRDNLFSGSGQLLVDGLLYISGNKLEYTNETTDLIAMYATQGIYIKSNNCRINGILYTPGLLTLDGNNNTFYGALIANEIYWKNNNAEIIGAYDIRAPQSFNSEPKTIFLLIE
ncbi:TadE/TadG family type IV pilus assembly protein [Heliorestis convoluta]|uniref:Flp pilus-assembly TadG-like family protein, putative n=1 Tax=Heliorestis convoluta TaxID=356322 RepID=A0A5Q2N4N1_9FIRM|nr:pilus assembly protein TadG-related protein [Heliorestis convoluta]QGG48566.1 flp pilus-assembly TadG-like family protein, putative [Heliorestis convoluta]